ncbi:MAG: hypothetical protein ACXW2C_10425 [Acidimicrobiia bacterium]
MTDLFEDPTDDELTELALAADPESPIAEDAVSLWELQGSGGTPLLPDWYMPAPVGGGHQLHDWRRWVVPVVIAAFVIINAYGLCSTYGQVTFG